jgi:hypothetical protein
MEQTSTTCCAKSTRISGEFSMEVPLIVSRNTLPAKNLTDLIAWLKLSADRASQGTAGAGSPQHIAGIYFQQQTGIRFQLVPYRGVAPAMLDLVTGQLDLMIDQPTNSLPQVAAGNIQANVVRTKTGLAAAPDIPTVDEAGLPRFYVSIWRELWVPDGPRRTSSTNSTPLLLLLWSVRKAAPGGFSGRPGTACRSSKFPRYRSTGGTGALDHGFYS